MHRLRWQTTVTLTHTSFRLVPKSVTVNDLEWRNGQVDWVNSPNSVALTAHYEKVVVDTPLRVSE